MLPVQLELVKLMEYCLGIFNMVCKLVIVMGYCSEHSEIDVNLYIFIVYEIYL